VQILETRRLAIPEILVIRFKRFRDTRGYFSETYRKSDFGALDKGLGLPVEFTQCNESYSVPGTVRGLHFQWDPYMGKLVRTLQGHMLDLVLDIRRGSPTFGKAIAHDMPKCREAEHEEWIWVPPGFAHGNVYLEDSSIEYFCTGQYSPDCQAGISPLAPDLDWSLCDPDARALCQGVMESDPLMSDKDHAGMTLQQWAADPRGENFIYGQL